MEERCFVEVRIKANLRTSPRKGPSSAFLEDKLHGAEFAPKILIHFGHIE